MEVVIEKSSTMFDKYEAAEYLGLKPQTLDNWRSTGRYPLRFIRMGRTIRYRRADLDAFIESRSVTPAEVTV